MSVLAETNTSLLQSAQLLLTIVKVAAGLGVLTTLAAVGRHWRHRKRWQRFKQLAEEWISETPLGVAESMNDDEWKALCERLLHDTDFNPFEMQQLLDVAVAAVRGLVHQQTWQA